MAVKAGYKQTEVGVIPNDWDLVALGSLLSFKNGLNKAKEYFGYGTPIVNYMDVFQKNGLLVEDIQGLVNVSRNEIRAYEVKKGDVFFTRTSETVEEIGTASVMLEDAKDTVFSGFVLRAKPTDESLDVDFKKYCFSARYFRQQVSARASYTTRALTNGRSLSACYLIRPPMAEQAAIATALSDADALIECLDQLIHKKRNIKQGAMQELLTGKKRLPGFSGEWEVKRLGDVANIKTGSRNNQDKVEDGEYPFFVRSEHVERINDFHYDCEAILIPGEGGIGSIFHYINGRFDVHQRVYAITDFAKDISGKFIYLYMKQNFGVHAMKNSVKATVDSLRLPTFIEFEITVPASIEEQTAIATILSDMDADIAALEEKLNKAKAVKQGMMQELLTGRVRLV
jgi:type I restriction enzyme S subunit